MPYESFKNMPVWQTAMDIAVKTFRLTEKLPRKEDYGLTSQIRRSALSISGNIAEAFGRKHTKNKVNFYYFARGSITETQSHVEYARKVGYINSKSSEEIDSRLGMLVHDLNKVIATLNHSSTTQPHS